MSRPVSRWDAEEALLAGAAAGRFVRPAWNGRSLPNLARSLFGAVGREPLDPPLPLAPPLDERLDPARGRQLEGPVVLFLVDSLGWCSFRQALQAPEGHAPGTLDRWAELAHPISTVFPSTTTAALTAISTASFPGRNGIVGHREFLPRWGVVADMLRMAPMTAPGHDTLIGPGWDPRDLTGLPTIFQLGLPACVLTRDRFAGTGFTRLLYAGAEFCGYTTASDLAHQLIQLLGRPAPPPVIFAYWDELDTVHHFRGPEPYLFELELERIAHLLGSVARRVGSVRARSTQVWVTGDHGQVPAPESANLAIDQQPGVLSALVHPPGGDRRAAFFAVRDGRMAELEATVRPLLPADSLFRPMREAIADGLFGPAPHHPEIGLRTGDLLVVPSQPAGITYAAPGDPVPRKRFLGAHSGLEREEMWVPLVAGSLEELGGARH